MALTSFLKKKERNSAFTLSIWYVFIYFFPYNTFFSYHFLFNESLNCICSTYCILQRDFWNIFSKLFYWVWNKKNFVFLIFIIYLSFHKDFLLHIWKLLFKITYGKKSTNLRNYKRAITCGLKSQTRIFFSFRRFPRQK